MEVLGGIGYCEESELPRLYREMPVNSIWEGSGNIMCLDVMRVLGKQPAALELLAAECAEVKGQTAISTVAAAAAAATAARRRAGQR
jgi:putative acyl-CoA dehydrogenase